LSILPIAAVAGLALAQPANAKPQPTGLQGVIVDLEVGGDGTNTVPNGSLILMNMVRRDNGHRVQVFIGSKTKLYMQGHKIRFRDLRDMLYATPEDVNNVYRDLPATVIFTGTQLARQVQIDP
jgi:hypothetical protein